MLAALASPAGPRAQDMIQYLDLKSDEFTKAEMTRAEVEAALAAAGKAGRADLGEAPQWARSRRPRSRPGQPAGGAVQ